MVMFEQAGAEALRPLPIEMIAPMERTVALLDFGWSTGGAEADSVAGGAADDVAATFAEDGAERIRVMIEAAREEAGAEVWRAAELAIEDRLRVERGRVERVSAEFARDRERYFAAAETQVVRLALAVAERVLCREVVADAMWLRGIVKAALARVAEDGVATLRVRHEEVAAWREMFPEGGASEVRVLAHEGIAAGECLLETGVGRVELGVRPQMAEIEHGFAELLQRC